MYVSQKKKERKKKKKERFSDSMNEKNGILKNKGMCLPHRKKKNAITFPQLYFLEKQKSVD